MEWNPMSESTITEVSLPARCSRSCLGSLGYFHDISTPSPPHILTGTVHSHVGSLISLLITSTKSLLRIHSGSFGFLLTLEATNTRHNMLFSSSIPAKYTGFGTLDSAPTFYQTRTLPPLNLLLRPYIHFGVSSGLSLVPCLRSERAWNSFLDHNKGGNTPPTLI